MYDASVSHSYCCPFFCNTKPLIMKLKVKEILLFYRNHFFRLTYQEIQGKNIYNILQKTKRTP